MQGKKILRNIAHIASLICVDYSQGLKAIHVINFLFSHIEVRPCSTVINPLLLYHLKVVLNIYTVYVAKPSQGIFEEETKAREPGKPTQENEVVAEN